ADAVCVRQDVERLRSRTARDKSALRDRAISVTGTPVVISWFAIGRSYHTVLAATTYDFGILCGRGQGDSMSGEASNQERLSGVLLHVTSLPSYGGVGDFGPAAYSFVDFLASARQRLWQVLPLSPTGYGSSPYSALSAFAGNPLLISLERLVSDGWLAGERIAGLPGHAGPADFDAAHEKKLPLIEEAAANFLDHA